MGDQTIKLTEDQISNAREAFDKYDRRGQDRIPIREIANAFKSCGVNIKHDWLDKMRDDIDKEGSGYISVDEFLHLYCCKLKSDEDERELREAFRILDKENKGQIPTDDLRWILKGIGDDLTDEDIEAMINDTEEIGRAHV